MCDYDIAFPSCFSSFNHVHDFDSSIRRIKRHPFIRRIKRRRLDDVTASTIKTRVCTHPGFIKGLCVACGRKADDDVALESLYAAAIPLRYILEDLRLCKDLIARVKVEDTENLLNQRKLYLVLDLDQTLLHSVSLQKMDPDKVQDLLGLVENSLKGELFHLHSFGMMTKLRPFVRTFLEEANTLFQMYIYTRGERRYAKEMAGLLDPEGVYFGSRIVAREDCTRANQKGLDVVLGQESAVLILDDKERVWPDHKENLMLMEKYNYFSPTSGGDESDGALPLVLEVLKKIHTQFFKEYDQAQLLKIDVRKVLKMVQEGCKL